MSFHLSFSSCPSPVPSSLLTIIFEISIFSSSSGLLKSNLLLPKKKPTQTPSHRPLTHPNSKVNSLRISLLPPSLQPSLPSPLTVSTAAPPSTMTSFQTIIAQHASEGWDLLWKATTTPWDKGLANPSLVALLEDVPQEVNLPEKGKKGVRALVAGCGRVSSTSFMCLGRRGEGKEMGRRRRR